MHLPCVVSIRLLVMENTSRQITCSERILHAANSVCAVYWKTPTCNAFAANLKTFSLSTSIISWETDQQGGGNKEDAPGSSSFLNPNIQSSVLPYNSLYFFSKWTLVFLFFFFYFLRLSPLYSSQQSEKIVPCRRCLLSWGATRVQRQWIIRELLSGKKQKKQQLPESCFITSNTRKNNRKTLTL